MADSYIKVALLIPTLNAGERWEAILNSCIEQNFNFFSKVIIDSGSSDETVELAKNKGFNVLYIDKKDFDHGFARQLLAQEVIDCDILVYLTQDAILADPDSISSLIKYFDDPLVGVAYGRQLPHQGAKTLESHARLFGYPATSRVKSLSDKDELGIRTATCSNSFAAYRKSTLFEIGGFPTNTIFAEDMIVAAKSLIAGWKVAYVADAKVYHSHNYTIKEEFKRYFDVGVFYSSNTWLFDEFGTANGEGLKYLLSESKYILKNNIFALPKMVFSIGAKFLGYKMGSMHKSLSLKWNKKLSMHKAYWNKINK